MPRTDTASCRTAHAARLGLLLISAYVCHGSVAAPSTGTGGKIVRFTCVKDDTSALPADDRLCSVGQQQLGMALVDSGLGRLSLELSNRGAGRSVVTEVRVVDEAATLSDSPLAEMTSSPGGQVHFKRANKEVPFFGSSGQSDLVLVRRPEVSRTGRMMKLNGINNSPDGGEALTLTLRTANEAFDAEIVGEAVRDCLLRVGVLVTGFEGDPSATRRFVTECNST